MGRLLPLAPDEDDCPPWELPRDQISSLNPMAAYRWKWGLSQEQKRLGLPGVYGISHEMNYYELQRRVVIARAEEGVRKSCDAFIQSELGANT